MLISWISSSQALLLRKHSRLLVVSCLLAMVWCQSALAAGWCSDGLVADADVASDCHGRTQTGAPDGGGGCPGFDGVPDFGKLPAIAPLPAGHDFSLDDAARRDGIAVIALEARPRDGPALDALCRLLI